MSRLSANDFMYILIPRQVSACDPAWSKGILGVNPPRHNYYKFSSTSLVSRTTTVPYHWEFPNILGNGHVDACSALRRLDL